jgi:hypothetical protein
MRKTHMLRKIVKKTVEIETERHVHKKSKRSKKIKSRIYSAQRDSVIEEDRLNSINDKLTNENKK